MTRDQARQMLAASTQRYRQARQQWETDMAAAAAAGLLATACGNKRLHDIPKEKLTTAIAEMEKAKSYSGNTWGTKGQPTADFNLLKFPVYLPLLAERQRK